MRNLSRRELLQSACTAGAAPTLGSNLPGESMTVARMLTAEGSAPPLQAAAYLEIGDGTKIYYEEDHREGQTILLVHGWMCSSKFWRKNVPELANEFRVVTLDLRGHGQGHCQPGAAGDIHPVRGCWPHSLLRTATEVQCRFDKVC